MTSEIVYQGQLRTQATHLRSKNTLITDAPVDNHGKGEAFSPTDLVATALASCMLSIMGIVANRLNISVDGAKASVNKIMSSGPRRIAAVEVTIEMPANNYTEKDIKMLENAAHTCPVALSLHDDLEQRVVFKWND